MSTIAFKLVPDHSYAFFGLMGMNELMIKHGLYAVYSHRHQHHQLSQILMLAIIAGFLAMSKVYLS